VFDSYKRKVIRTIRILRGFKNWHTYILDRYGILSEGAEIVYVLYDGTRIIARAGRYDWYAIENSYIHEVYTPPELSFSIGKNDVVVDIGAYIGDFTLYAARRARVVYAYEPLPDNYNLLLRNIKLNSLDNVKAFNLAVSGSRGTKSLYIPIRGLQSASLYRLSDVEYIYHITVHSVTLEDVLEENSIEKVDLLKMDCEGCEYDALLNTPFRVLRRIRRISLEWHGTPEGIRGFIELKNILKQVGFNVVVRGAYLYARQ